MRDILKREKEKVRQRKRDIADKERYHGHLKYCSLIRSDDLEERLIR
jgi:hypothetical protein